MTTLNDCLETHAPRILEFPAGIPAPEDPVSWALEMFRDDVVFADMQTTKVKQDKESEPDVIFFDQQDPECFERFRSGIENGQPVHGSLELIDYRDDGGTLRQNAEWSWQVFNEQFKEGLAQKHSMGYYFKSTLWMSCGEHCYKAHCDFADGFLMHITGSKRVRVWPVPERFQEQVIYDHSDFKARMESDFYDFELEPGQILYIPASAMHEVVAHGNEPAVSVSFHMGSPFPLLSLCDQLNNLNPEAKITLAQQFAKNQKFNLSFFQLSRFAHAGGGEDGRTLPPELAEALLKAFKSKELDSTVMHEVLSHWWQVALNQPVYPGPPRLVK